MAEIGSALAPDVDVDSDPVAEMSMRISFPTSGNRTKQGPTVLYLLTWCSLAFSLFIFVTSILDMGLWMNISAALVTILYHIAVLFLSARTPEVAPAAILITVSTAGCAAILVFAWIAGLAMTILVVVVGRENFPGPAPLVEMTSPVHLTLGVLTGVEMLVMVAIARLSDPALGASPGQLTALPRRLLLRPVRGARRLLSV